MDPQSQSLERLLASLPCDAHRILSPQVMGREMWMIGLDPKTGLFAGGFNLAQLRAETDPNRVEYMRHHISGCGAALAGALQTAWHEHVFRTCRPAPPRR